MNECGRRNDYSFGSKEGMGWFDLINMEIKTVFKGKGWKGFEGVVRAEVCAGCECSTSVSV